VSFCVKLGWPLTDLSFDGLHSAVASTSGLKDFGDTYYQTGLKVLLQSIDQNAAMHTYGRFIMRILLLNYLNQRLHFVETLKKKPASFETTLNPPWVITGLPRSGTTFLHRLLSTAEGVCGVPYWQLFRPFPRTKAPDLRRWVAWLELNILRPLYPDMDVKHLLRADVPEEDIWLMGLTFHSPVFWILAPVSGYMQWLCQADRRQAYHDYGLLLRWYQAAQPEKTLVMKAPDHLLDLDLLLEAVPNARVIQLNRDPATCALSLSSLLYSAHGLFTENRRPGRLHQVNQELVAAYLRKSQRARTNQTLNQSIVDLDYATFVQNPVGTVGEITGLQVSSYQDQRSKHKKHHYKPEDFGTG
jgi:hypothetical protein